MIAGRRQQKKWEDGIVFPLPMFFFSSSLRSHTTKNVFTG